MSRVKTLLVPVLAYTVFSTSSACGSDWLCTQSASQRQGDAYLVCGIGVAKDEQSARLKALVNAKQELKELCSTLSECRQMELEPTPLRTDCELQSNGDVKCYRAIRYDLTNRPSKTWLLDEQNRILDEEIEIAERRAELARQVRSKELKLAALEKETEMGKSLDNEAINMVPMNYVLGVDLSLTTSVFPSEGELILIGVRIEKFIFRWLSIEGGANLDMWFPANPYSDLEFDIKAGFSTFLALPIYFSRRELVSEYQRTDSGFFLAPEVRYINHIVRSTFGYGFSAGYQLLGSRSGQGARFKAGVTNLGGTNSSPAGFFTVSFIWGL